MTAVLVSRSRITEDLGAFDTPILSDLQPPPQRLFDPCGGRRQGIMRGKAGGVLRQILAMRLRPGFP